MADTVPALMEYKVSFTMCSGSTKKGCFFLGKWDFNRQLSSSPPPSPSCDAPKTLWSPKVWPSVQLLQSLKSQASPPPVPHAVAARRLFGEVTKN